MNNNISVWCMCKYFQCAIAPLLNADSLRYDYLVFLVDCFVFFRKKVILVLWQFKNENSNTP